MPVPMKMVMVVYNEAMDDEVMEVLERCVMKNYTKITGALGKGATSGTHHDNDIWPGKNNILYVACEASQADQMLACCRNLRTMLGKEGVKAFVWSLDQVTL